MRFSKDKVSCAYNKSKTKQKLTPSHNEQVQIPLLTDNQLKQHLYEELMNDLQIQDSQYIQKLLHKNEQKMERINADNTKGKTTNTDQYNFNKNDHQTRNQMNGQSHTSSKDLNFVVQLEEGFIQERIKKQKHKQINEESSLSYKSSNNNHFLSGIDNYLTTLNTQPSIEAPTRKQSIHERCFRNTINITQKLRYEPVLQISTAKYEDLLNKLEETLMKKDRLESKLAASDYKMRQMKVLIKSMNSQLQEISSELHQQKMQKEKYSAMLQQFASKVRSVRRSSKQPYYLPTHSKRNSYATPTHDQYIHQDYFSINHLNKILCEKTNKCEPNKKQTAPLKKKRKTHQNKVNEDLVKTKEGHWRCDSASICNDRSSRRSRF